MDLTPDPDSKVRIKSESESQLVRDLRAQVALKQYNIDLLALEVNSLHKQQTKPPVDTKAQEKILKLALKRKRGDDKRRERLLSGKGIRIPHARTILEFADYFDVEGRSYARAGPALLQQAECRLPHGAIGFYVVTEDADTGPPATNEFYPISDTEMIHVYYSENRKSYQISKHTSWIIGIIVTRV
jgi:hypothetical protein